MDGNKVGEMVPISLIFFAQMDREYQPATLQICLRWRRDKMLVSSIGDGRDFASSCLLIVLRTKY